MSAESSSPWLGSRAWDLFWIHSGFWLLAAHALLIRVPAAFEIWYALLFLVFWMSHRAGTVYLSYATPEYRPLVAANPGRFVAYPLGLFAFAAAVLFAPASVLSAPLSDRLLALGVIRFWYDMVHFGGQHYGVVSLYRARGGQDPASPLKAAEKAFCFSAAAFSMVLPVAFGRALPPAWRLAAAATFVLAAAALAAAELREKRPSTPKLLYVCWLAVIVAVALNAASALQAVLIVAVQHYVVAAGLTTRMMAGGEKSPSRQPLATLFLLGLIPAYLGWRAAQVDSVDWLFRGWLDNSDRGPGFRAAAALAYGFSYAHNGWDAAVFRFKDPATRAVTLPLLLGRRA